MKDIMPPINTPDKSFHDGNPATGEQGTIVSAEWLNNAQGGIRNTQQELLSVLTEAGMAIDENKTNQLLLAILNLITNRSPDFPIGSITQKGIVQLSNSTSSISEVLAATPKAVKAAIDASLPVGGTAASATKLATARKIGGVDFDGTKDITLPFISTTDTNVQFAGNIAAAGRCDIVGDVRGGRIISKNDVVAGEGRAEGHATFAVDGNIYGSLWGTNLYNYITDLLIGIPLPYPLATAPSGFLKCNGAAFSTTTYPRLALKYPSGVLPDMRGDVIRAWDDGRGVDAGRVLLSEQGFAMQNITGSLRVSSIFADPGTAATGAFTVAASGVVGEGYNSAGLSPLFTFNAANVVVTATETRMRNIAFNYIVRAL